MWCMFSINATDEKEGETMRINGVSDNLSIEELADILEKMYNTPEESGKAMSPIIFGFKYAHVIDINRYSIANILSKTSAFSIIKQFECEFKAHCIEFSIDKIYKSSYIKNMGTYTISQFHIRFQVWHK